MTDMIALADAMEQYAVKRDAMGFVPSFSIEGKDQIIRVATALRTAARPDAGYAVKDKTEALKTIYDKLAAEGGGTWATYMMMDIDALLEQPATPGYAAGFEACRQAAIKAADDNTPAKFDGTLAAHVVGKTISAALSALPAPAPAAEVTAEQIERLFNKHILVVPLDIDTTEYVIPRYSLEAFIYALLSRFHITAKAKEGK